MRFSIVTLSYNQAQHLEEALRSVISQEGVDLQYIVVDPGSTDGSRDVIEKYRDQIDQVILEPDEGPADGLNKGFAFANGELLGYLNSDDRLLPGALRAAADEFARKPQLDLLSGHGYLIDEYGELIHRVFSHRFDLTCYAEQFCVLIQPSTFMRARAFRSIEGFNVANRVSWDGELAVDLALAGARFGIIQEYLSEFRFYESSISASDDYGERLVGTHERIRAKIGARRRTPLQRRVLWASAWLRQPDTLVRRMLDGVVNRDRKL